MKKTLLVLTLVMVLSFGTMVAFADSINGPADVYANLAGITAAEAYELKGDMTFGDLAKEAGFYDEFHAASVELKVDLVQSKADEGIITQAEADEIISILENCDGNGENTLKNSGLFMRFGQGRNNGQNRGNGESLNPQDGTGYQRGNRGGNGFGRK